MLIPRTINTRPVFQENEWYVPCSYQLIRNLVRFSRTVSDEYRRLEAILISSPDFLKKDKEAQKKRKRGLWPNATENIYNKNQSELCNKGVNLELFQMAINRVGGRLRSNKQRRKKESKTYHKSVEEHENLLVDPDKRMDWKSKEFLEMKETVMHGRD